MSECMVSGCMGHASKIKIFGRYPYLLASSVSGTVLFTKCSFIPKRLGTSPTPHKKISLYNTNIHETKVHLRHQKINVYRPAADIDSRRRGVDPKLLTSSCKAPKIQHHPSQNLYRGATPAAAASASTRSSASSSCLLEINRPPGPRMVNRRANACLRFRTPTIPPLRRAFALFILSVEFLK